ncbi:MAG: DNA adenine methylase [Anaerolineae bacterium]|nr:DNA adenine methylase [Anaerolineae bacterium]
MTASANRPRPVLKWAGGKGRLLPELQARLPDSFATYHEPFIGGGALFFTLAGQGHLGRARLSDANPSLIDVYLALRDCVDEIIKNFILARILLGSFIDQIDYPINPALNSRGTAFKRAVARYIVEI